ncbi:MAG: TIGR04282 family arsenosugar biosynthesis glycosyltransferase [Gammaproteobacteria bacterium]|nr:TIGR04282 family arsenosugar biosynthesis glycosyltransferase [Gammaproteobacteria bacterium]
MPLQNFPHPDTLIIIFAREPVSGQVKTRLIPALGKEGAAELYRRLLDFAIDNVITAELSPINLCLTPESRSSYFTEMPYADQFELSVQVGHDLGARMYNALAAALKHYSKAILIGTDCPFINKADFQQAIAALDSHDMVFSPARDGGYVLVGANRVIPDVFENIGWGTENVMAQSRIVLAANDFRWQELAEQCDIDIKNDLKYLLLHDEFKEFISGL